MFIYYNIEGGWHCGSLGVENHLPNADSFSSAELMDLGWVKADIPNDWKNVYCKYEGGQLSTQNTPFVEPILPSPPYWEDLQLGLARLAISQRLLAESVFEVGINTAFTMVIGAIAFKDYPSLKNSLGRVVDILAYTGSALISPEEMAELQSLLLDCGFTPEVWAEMID